MAGKGKRGRPSKLTPELQAEIVKVLSAGLYRQDAAHFVGIDPATLRAWMKKGREGRRGRYVDLHAAVIDAEKRVKQLCTLSILQAARGTPTKTVKGPDGTTYKTKGKDADWKAAAWYLERKFPEEFRRQQLLEAHHQVVAQVEHKETFDLSQMLADPDAVAALDLLASKQVEAERAAEPAQMTGGNGAGGGNGSQPPSRL